MSVKITDLVDPNEIEKLKQLDAELKSVLDTYTKVAKDLAKGIDVNVSVTGDIDRLEKILVDKGKEAAAVQRQLTQVLDERSKAVANTTNTISRQLMEQERVNKSQREAYTEYDRVKKLLEQYHDTYEGQIQSLIRINRELEANKKAQKDNEKALSTGRMTLEQYQTKQAELIAQSRALTQEKRTLTQIMTAEEKAAQAQEGSYAKMSQQLELLKKAYKELGEEGRESEFGKELETSIQNLDAHLKDMAADMGEFQRNVGNYAIAGQQGVVSTESVVAALEQEAKTIQDLIDQTKILEEAKKMLDSNDESYASTLDALNAKIDENRRKLSDVTDILHKDATSVAEAEAQNKRLQDALKNVDLTSDDAEKQIKELNAKIAANTKIIKQNTPAIEDQVKATEQATKANEEAADELLGLVGINGAFGQSLKNLGDNNAGGVLDGLGTKAKALGKTLLGLLTNPWVLTFLGIAGVAAGVKWWYDYNKGLIEATKLTQDFTGLSGSELKGVRNEVQAVADAYDKDFREVLEATNAMAKQFGISFQEAIKLVEDGFVSGADVNEEFLENIKEYPAYFKEAGLSASEFIAITTQANKAGIYSDKGIDVIKEGNLRIREMTTATADALNAIGISSKEVQQSLADGSKTTFDIMQEVSAKLAEFPEASSEVGTALADIFGGPGEDAGLQYILTLKDIDTNLDNVKDNAGRLAELQEEQLRSQVELENVIASVFDTTGGNFEAMTTKAKTFVNDGIIAIIKGLVDIINWFVRMYNQSIVVRGAVNSIVNTFKTMWEVSKFILNQIVDSFKAMGTVIEGIVTLDWDKVTKGWSDGMNALKGNVETMARNIANNTANAFNNTLSGKMNEVKLDVGINETASSVSANRAVGKSGYKVRESDEEKKAREKAAKESEKAAKDELKRINELEDAKIAVMVDSHNKDIALIRLKFKKKIEEIKGDGATEVALRVQLAEQCQQEIAACELKYQKELTKINLENRLAVAKKGSEEELLLKLAQLEAARKEELVAAEKNGADINLINAKYAKLREDAEEAHAQNVIEIIEKRYADVQSDRDNAMMLELADLQSWYAKELKAIGTNEADRARLKEFYEGKSADITEKYAIQSAKAAIDKFDEILATEELSADDRERIERELAAAKIAYQKAVTESVIAESDRQVKADTDATKKRLENAQQWLQVASDSLNAINDLVAAVYDGKIQKVEEEQEANTAAGEAEQERIAQLVENNVITEEEGEARKRAAEAKTAKKNEELEKKKQKIKQKQAVWDKANNLAQAGIATALAITRALPNLVLAAIVGAMGALQVATILATPIPKYAKGTEHHKGGPAIVGDGGVPELVIFSGKSWVTPDTPTLVDMPAGAIVKPNIEGVEGIIPATNDTPGGSPSPVVINNDNKRLEEKMDKFIYLLRCHSNRQHNDAINNALNRYIAERI